MSEQDWGSVDVEGKANVVLVVGAFVSTYILFIFAGWTFVMGAGHPDVVYSTTTYLLGVIATIVGHKAVNKLVGPRIAEHYRSKHEH